MKIVKIILAVIVVLIATPLIVALFVAKDYEVEREIVIAKPRSEVFAYVRDVRNQHNYSVWELADPAMHIEYFGTPGTVGAGSAWDSKVDTVGKGEMKIAAIEEGSRVEIALHFIKPFDGRATAHFATADANGTQTKVKWGLTGRMAYPMNLFLIMGMKDKLGNELQQGLNNLKNVLENNKTAVAEIK